MKILLISLLVLNMLVVGCTNVPTTGYYWGNYSQTLYRYKKSPSAKTLSNHQTEIEKILRISKEKQRTPPPGLNAELGQIFLNRGDKNQATAYFQAEANTFPESLPLMQHLIKQISDPKSPELK